MKVKDKVGAIRVVEVDWTAIADGSVAAILTAESFLGKFIGAEAINGDPAPTASYTVKIRNHNLVILGTILTANSFAVWPGQPYVFDGGLSILVEANSVNAAKGKVKIFIEE